MAMNERIEWVPWPLGKNYGPDIRWTIKGTTDFRVLKTALGWHAIIEHDRECLRTGSLAKAAEYVEYEYRKAKGLECL